jgi:hypothetical protein
MSSMSCMNSMTPRNEARGICVSPSIVRSSHRRVTGNIKITLSASSVCVGEKASSSAARALSTFPIDEWAAHAVTAARALIDVRQRLDRDGFAFVSCQLGRCSTDELRHQSGTVKNGVPLSTGAECVTLV